MEYGKKIQDVIVEGSGDDRLHAYVNYAAGRESLEELYGFEGWRLERLRALKKLYDPHNRFKYYLPVNREETVELDRSGERMEL